MRAIAYVHPVTWLLDAAQNHNEHWLAYMLEQRGAMKGVELKQKPSGGYTSAHVPENAAETLAEGQFNRFYIAAICRRALDDGGKVVKVYRAKARENPRAESIAMEGAALDAGGLLAQVRDTKASFACELLKPNSGLSVDC